jgi:branched-chain amino acid transport system ATP-binding protein
MSTALVLERVAKHFGGVQAVRDVSLQVAVGERRVIIGPNGAGKTSLFHCISGVLSVTSGRIQCLGHDMTLMPEHQRTLRGIGRTFQISSVFSDLTVLENIALARLGVSPIKWSLWRNALAQTGLRELAREQLERVGLSGREAWPVQSLSYGEKRQLELVLALVNQPQLLLLDEPCAGLSPAERHRLSAIIQALPRSITMLMIEHDMDVALGLADRVTVLHQGEVIVEGNAYEVQHDRHVQEVYFGQL